MTRQEIVQDKVLLLTGGAGFLGKVILEQVIRRRHELGLEKVILLIRPDRKRSAEDRFSEKIAKSACFKLLPLGWEKDVEILSGDLTLSDWGLNSAQRGSIAQRVTHIIHAAASVDFNLPIKEAASANITTTLSVLEFAKSCQKITNLVYVSTAYVRPHQDGSIPEALVDVSFEPAKLYDDMIHNRCHQIHLLKETGHPNTYTLTKCVAEHLAVKNRGNLPLTIVRPSIISAAIKHPFPGWIDSYAALAAFVGVFGAGYLRVVAADPEALLDVIPVDVVAETIVNQSFKYAPNTDQPMIVHAAVGLSNAMRIGDLPRHGQEYFSRLPSRRSVYIRYIGPLCLIRRIQHLWFERLPTKIVWLGALFTGQKALAQRIAKLDHILASIFKIFPYFTHHSFDFKVSHSKDLDLAKIKYVDLICEGVQKNLLKESPNS
jgi:thioester reductase-like protein